MNHLGRDRFQAFSAGSRPTGRVHPLAVETLEGLGMKAHGVRSKSWDEFAHAGAPKIDDLITVCDNAAREPCPVWPGKRATAHWGLPDPAAVEGSDAARRAAFLAVAQELQRRIRELISKEQPPAA